MRSYKQYMVIGMLALLSSGCNQAPKKTDSMVRRDNANAASQALVSKAQTLVTANTFTSPENHLDQLVMIQDLLRESEAVYKEARILNWESPNLQQLESDLLSVNKPLAIKSLDAFELAVEKSVAFKQRKADVESLPVYDNSVAKHALFQHLKKFNRDLEECCLDRILLINRFLRSEEEKYYGIIKLGHNTLHYMGMLIRGEISEAELHNKIVVQRKSLN